MSNNPLYKQIKGETFAFSSENPTGSKNGGSKDKPYEKNHPNTMVKPNETLTLVDVDGSGVIENIWIGGDVSNNFILRIYWDNSEYPSVEAPLPAFFGYAYPRNIRDIYGNFPTLNSAMMMVAPCRGMNCYFEMPYRKHCKITVENRHPKEERCIYYTITGIKKEVEEDALYFHATYRQSKPTTGGIHTILDGVSGQGHYCGLTMAIGTNGTNDCFVEGEMKMYVDDDKYPSINYTGTEDYFGGSYAFGLDLNWCHGVDQKIKGKYEEYSGLYSGMFGVLGDRDLHYNAQPRYLLYRFHVNDPIIFNKNIRVEIQNMHFTDHGHLPRRDDIISVAYWYQKELGTKLKELPSDAELDER